MLSDKAGSMRTFCEVRRVEMEPQPGDAGAFGAPMRMLATDSGKLLAHTYSLRSNSRVKSLPEKNHS